MKNKFQVIVMRWENGDYKSKDSFDAFTLDFMERSFISLIGDLRLRMKDEEERRSEIIDDDVPF